MVNLSLFRHYEVLKRANSAVRFSLVLIAAWAATVILLFKLSKLTLSPLDVDWDFFATASIIIFLSVGYALYQGVRGGDAERKNADTIINGYLISNNKDEASSIVFCEKLNEATSNLEESIFKANAFNGVVTFIISAIYFWSCKRLIFPANYNYPKGIVISVLLFLSLFAAAQAWAYFKSKSKAREKEEQMVSVISKRLVKRIANLIINRNLRKSAESKRNDDC